VGGGVQTGSTRHVGRLLAYCTCPVWLWGWRIWWNERQGKPKYSEKTCPDATLSTTNPTWPDAGLNPSRRGGKPATNRFRYGAATSLCDSFEKIQAMHCANMFSSFLAQLMQLFHKFPVSIHHAKFVSIHHAKLGRLKHRHDLEYNPQKQYRGSRGLFARHAISSPSSRRYLCPIICLLHNPSYLLA
jgi:hypothetical protein